MEKDFTTEDIVNIEKEAVKGLKKTLGKIKKTKKKTKIIVGIILVIVLIIGGFLIFRKKESPYEIGEVMRGDIVEEVSVTGGVESAEEVDLRFKTSGIVDRINVKVGDVVRKGTYLIQLSSGDVSSQFLQAQASYNQAKAKLDQLLIGATTEEIKVAEQVVDLQEDYNNALVYLVDSSSKCNKAIADLKDIERTYFYRSSSLENLYREKRSSAENSFFGDDRGKDMVDKALDDPINENIDSALSEMKTALEKTIDALDYAKKSMSDPTIREDVVAADKATIDTDISNINSAYSNINSAKNSISYQRINNRRLRVIASSAQEY